jgi:hypothetical protein
MKKQVKQNISKQIEPESPMFPYGYNIQKFNVIFIFIPENIE